MKAIMVMYDSLNRRLLPPYGAEDVHAPNFARLAAKAVTFNQCFVGSMPCMPARRELHTGRYNFLHCPWSPLQPFDDSMPNILKRNGVWTHLVSDHYHYWEEGGANYHTKYTTWECVRGQEGDPWSGDLNPPPTPNPNGEPVGLRQQDWVNRQRLRSDDDYPQMQTFRRGLDFIERNAGRDNWFLQLETFDPHEPFTVPKRFTDLYDYDASRDLRDWPSYGYAPSPELARHFRMLNAALVSMCDENLGRVLDLMDRLDLWQDTMLIVNTDHGFFVGERGYLGKCRMPMYHEIANTPLFIWDPRSGRRDVHRQALVQTIDLPATLLEYFGQPLPPDMQGKPLRQTIVDDTPVREAALYGLFGAQVNCTDGHHVYMRGQEDRDVPANAYTLMPAHMRAPYTVEELRGRLELSKPFSFTKGCQTLRILGERGVPSQKGLLPERQATFLFDLDRDPGQTTPLRDPVAEARMRRLMVRLMHDNDAPPEQFDRLGLDPNEG